jgi:hypothetical protein
MYMEGGVIAICLPIKLPTYFSVSFALNNKVPIDELTD